MSVQTFLKGRVTLHAGDCLAVLPTLDENGVDSCVTDAPYHLHSIVKRFSGGEPAHTKTAKDIAGRKTPIARLAAGFMGKVWDGGDVAFRPETWAAVLRVLKPGAHLIAFGGTRTYHRLACAIEDAGFEIRDAIMWHYGSGFPKSLSIGKAIDRAAGAEREVVGSYGQGFRAGGSGLEGWQRPAHHVDKGITAPATDSARQWEGWGTALKPATEILVLARRPLSEKTVAANVLKHGTGAINIDKCRVTSGDDSDQTLGPSPALQLCGLDSVRRSEIAQLAYSIADTIPSRIDGHVHCILSTLSSWAEYGQPPIPLSANGGACDDCLSSIEDSQYDCQFCRHSRDELLRLAEAAGLWPQPSRRDVLGDTSHRRREWSRIRTSLCSVHRANWDDVLGCVSCSTYIQRPQKSQYIPNGKNAVYGDGMGGGEWNKSTLGRWPANCIHDGSDEVVEAFPETSAANVRVSEDRDEQQSTWSLGRSGITLRGINDSGGSAARFFYTAKADSDDRLGSKHPTVKPLDLMQYLVRLVTPPRGLILDPFAGTGTTAEAAWREGFNAVLIEREPEYLADIERRMSLCLAGPDERARESIKARLKGKPQDHGPLFGEAAGGLRT